MREHLPLFAGAYALLSISTFVRGYLAKEEDGRHQRLDAAVIDLARRRRAVDSRPEVS